MTRFLYPTTAGSPSTDDTFVILIEHVRLAEEAAYALGHLYKAQGDDMKGQGFLAVGEMFKYTVVNITNLATKSMRSQAGFR